MSSVAPSSPPPSVGAPAADRVVVAFVLPPSAAGRAFVARAMALVARGEARGGELVAWSSTTFGLSFDAASARDAIALATMPGEDTAATDMPWAVGIAQGELRAVTRDGAFGSLSHGPSLDAAVALAQAARPGEVLCHGSVRALRTGEVVGVGDRVARVGGQRVKGARLDPVRPFRAQLVELLAQLTDAKLVGAFAPSATPPRAGAVLVVRAGPGGGGTRALVELAAGRPTLYLEARGAGLEPLGALRRALARLADADVPRTLVELAKAREDLARGAGCSLGDAVALVELAFPSDLVLQLDDAARIDTASLDVAARLVAGSRAALVARIGSEELLPPALAALPLGGEVRLSSLGAVAAAELASQFTGGALDAEGRRRFGRLGCGEPLGVFEAVAYGIESGELVWTGDVLAPRRRASGRGRPRRAAQWVLARAQLARSAERVLLGTLALLGGEARVGRMTRILHTAGVDLDVDPVARALERGQWLLRPSEDELALPTRTHVLALERLLPDDTRAAVLRAAAVVIAEEEGELGGVPAAPLALEGGERVVAEDVLVRAVARARELGLDGPADALVALAEAHGLDVDLDRPTRPPSERLRAAAPPLPAVPSLRPPDSEPPTIALPGVSPRPATSALVDALVRGDADAVRTLTPGGAEGATDLVALAEARGGAATASLPELRRGKALAASEAPERRCRACLALGLGLLAAGREDDALLEALEALLEARRAAAPRAEEAAFALLARVYRAAGRTSDATVLGLRAAPTSAPRPAPAAGAPAR